MVEVAKRQPIVIATRMPDKPKQRVGGTPFDQDGDIVVDCDQPGCGWHAMGPRKLIKKAMDEHQRMYHAEQGSVILLNQPKQ
jgi:hypothetical protein